MGGFTADILIVDDEPQNLHALETVLAPLGHQVATASSGEEALRRLLQRDFHVIVLDVRMPAIDGFETAELIRRRKRNEDAAIIFLTAADQDAEAAFRGYAVGAVDYIVKPVDADVLRSKVAILLELQRKNAALRDSEERFRAAFAGAPIGMALITPDGRWLEANEALGRMLGRSPRALVETQIWELAPPGDRERERRELARLLEQRPRLHQREKRFLHGDGRIVHALVSVSLALDAQGRPLNFVWQMVDLTERRRAEAERAERVRERAARAEAEAVAETIGTLQRVTEAALEHHSLNELLQALVERAAEAFEVEAAAILLRQAPDDASLEVGATTGFGTPRADLAVPLGDDFVGRIVAEGRPVALAELPQASALDPLLAAGRLRSVLGVPMFVQGRVSGVVEVGTRGDRSFTSEDESLLMLIADRAGLAIEHARVYERERGMVETLQRALLPDKLPRLPGLEIAARYLPGEADVGGDWYDAIPLDDGGLALAMGDVVGHGIEAASLMGQLRNAVRAYLVDGHGPAAVLDRIDALLRGMEGDQMATLLVLMLDPELTELRFSSAGHLPPLVVGPGGRPRLLDEARDPPLGVLLSAGHAEFSSRLERGSTVVLYTDGLVEERGMSIDVGLRALRRAASSPHEPEALCDQLVSSMLDHRPTDDDVAVLALRTLSHVSDLRLELPTDPQLLAAARRELGGWLRAAGASRDETADAQIACHEASMNAIEHGHGFADGTFTVEATVADGELVMTVGDTGRWRDQSRSPAHRGRGLPLIEALMDSVEVTPGPDGTVVQMRRRLRARAERPA